MKKRMAVRVLAVLYVLAAASCGDGDKPASDNAELERLFAADQASRSEEADEPLEPKDAVRRRRVMEMVVAGEVLTPADHFRAATIMHHTGLMLCNDRLLSISPDNYYLAHELAETAFEQGYKRAAMLAAQTIDRYLWLTEGYQRYGTQRIIESGVLKWVPMDPSTTDEERARYGVPPLDSLLRMAPAKPFSSQGGAETP